VKILILPNFDQRHPEPTVKTQFPETPAENQRGGNPKGKEVAVKYIF
jgi:hypothetical protein